MGRAASGRSAALHAATTPGRVRAARMSIVADPRVAMGASHHAEVEQSLAGHVVEIPAGAHEEAAVFLRRGELPIKSLVWSMPRSVTAHGARREGPRG